MLHLPCSVLPPGLASRGAFPSPGLQQVTGRLGRSNDDSPRPPCPPNPDDGCDEQNAMATSVTIPTNCSRESVQRLRRVTRENRCIWYQLTVLQQPERARACGSGMKANSDRRPVDPPPVVEFRIIEGPSVEEGKDITFDYNANFFLYASLEQACNVVHGRVQTPAASNPPILTGVPASGMAYLDRPSECGYFIFPDLSVRHEGFFRLSFSLFETTKEEKDYDLEPSDSDLPPGVDWRMEIKTQPFNVYSAKKFPGLMESTLLSKTVADQGCRVRIRRDVRMRKRESKGNGYERREDDYGHRRTETPAANNDDGHGMRSRSLSKSSEPRMPYVAESSRRLSAAESYPPPPPGYDAPPASSRGHLSFGDGPPAPFAMSRHYPAQPGMAAPPSSSPSRPYSASHSPYGYRGRTLSSACPSPAPSGSNYVTPTPSTYSADEHGRRDSHASLGPTSLVRTPPSRPPAPAQKQMPSLAPLKIASLVSPLPTIEVQTEPLPPAPPAVLTGSKRKHNTVFHQSTQPLHNAKRTQDAHHAEASTSSMSDAAQGMYSRADGNFGVVEFSHWQ